MNGKLEQVTTYCGGGTCPTVYTTGDPDTVVVQGYATRFGDNAIEIPVELAQQYMALWRADGGEGGGG